MSKDQVIFLESLKHDLLRVCCLFSSWSKSVVCDAYIFSTVTYFIRTPSKYIFIELPLGGQMFGGGKGFDFWDDVSLRKSNEAFILWTNIMKCKIIIFIINGF